MNKKDSKSHFLSDKEKENQKNKELKIKSDCIKYFNKVDRPVLIGELSLFLKISLEETEEYLNLFCLDDAPSIRKLTEEEAKKSNLLLAYVLVGKASLAIARS